MSYILSFFVFNDSATTQIYTLSLHDALPICDPRVSVSPFQIDCEQHGSERWVDSRTWAYDFDRDLPAGVECTFTLRDGDRKSTRLNSSHVSISYAVFCLKKKRH